MPYCAMISMAFSGDKKGESMILLPLVSFWPVSLSISAHMTCCDCHASLVVPVMTAGVKLRPRFMHPINCARVTSLILSGLQSLFRNLPSNEAGLFFNSWVSIFSRINFFSNLVFVYSDKRKKWAYFSASWCRLRWLHTSSIDLTVFR